MAKATLDDIYNIVVNMQNNMNSMQNNMNSMQNNMNSMQNTLLSMKDDIHRLDKRMDHLEQKIDDTKAELKNDINKIIADVPKEFDRCLDLAIETLKPEIDNVVAFLEPQGYVSVREKNAKYEV